MFNMIHFICFALLLPCEMLIWGCALDRSLSGSYLAKRISLSLFMEIPVWVLILPGLLLLYGFLRSSMEESRKGIRSGGNGMQYMYLCSFTGILFLIFRLPCSFALLLPLMMLICTAAWYAHASGKTALTRLGLLSGDRFRKNSFQEWCRAFHLFFLIQCGACLLFQRGYLLWCIFPVSSVIAFLPFLGLFQRSAGQLRGYVYSSFTGLILCAFLYSCSRFVISQIPLSDLSIFCSVLFVVLELMLSVRQYVGKKVRNLSILLLLPGTGLTYFILFPVCSYLIVSFFAFIFYVIIDNLAGIKHFIFSFAHRRKKFKWNILSDDEYKAAAWGCGCTLTAFLLGPDHIKEVLICTGVLLGSSLLRTVFLSNRQEDHIILKNFPYIVEIIFLGIALLILSPARNDLVVALCAFSCGGAAMQAIWHMSRIWNHSAGAVNAGPRSRLFLAGAWLLNVFIMVQLYFWQIPACLFLGLSLIFSGVIRIWDSAFRVREEERKLTAGWVLIILGQFISVTSPKIVLPLPEWDRTALLCGFLAVTALYIFRLLDRRNHNKEILS